jgi:hypothetical protein
MPSCALPAAPFPEITPSNTPQAEQQLLAVHVSALLSKGFRPLMSGHRVSDLARLYSLLGRVGGTEALREEWRQYIVATGTAIVKDEPNVSGTKGGVLLGFVVGGD